ncbi:hypothetical protein L3X38_011006 [Prunus dulcis]|uniref:CCHC-type domain-containing protein n=1 Tax=Prunus dulcis TaxID=3755 RepID=A0AAD4WGK3_PRUDU|nr:hypothetical protein L3X38_011006 [Prunus dulcis]
MTAQSSYSPEQDKLTKKIVLQGKSNQGLYHIPLATSSVLTHASCFSSAPVAYLGQQIKSSLWHKRLGHPTNEVVKLMLRASAVSVSTDSVSALCSACLHDKMHRLPFPSEHIRSKIAFQRIHSDVWGPSRNKSIDGYRCYVSFVDECTGFLCFPVAFSTIRVEEILASVKVYDKREDIHDERDKLAGTEKAFSSLRVGNNQASGANKSSQGKQNQKWQGQNKKGSNWSQVCRHKGKPRCGKCNRFGHLTKDCDNGKQVANCAKEEEVTTGTMFYACDASSIASSKSVWFVDSACSNHMTSQESLLINLDKSVTCKVKMGTGDLVQATGKGTLVVETRKGRRYINEVLLVPRPR